MHANLNSLIIKITFIKTVGVSSPVATIPRATREAAENMGAAGQGGLSDVLQHVMGEGS